MNSGNDLDPDDVLVDPHEWPQFDRSSYWARGRDRDRIGASLFVLWLVPTAIQAVQLGHPVALVLVLTGLYAASYLTVWWRGHTWPPAGRIALVCVLFGLGLGCVAVTTPAGSPSVLGYALSAAIMLLPLAWSQWVGVVCVVGCGLGTWWYDGQVDTEATLILALIAVITLGLSRSARLVGKLHQARGEVRTLAVAGERARLA
ncbi:MAG TPA: hypothetical protein VNP03_24085, partial [Pseudonocardia sp.]|nr:hypothetical protein [Pseudonocardia sp.]